MYINLNVLGAVVLGGAALILLIYLIVLVRNLIPSVKSLSKILKDAEVVTDVAAEGAKEAKIILENVSSSVSSVSEAVKGNQNVVAAITSVINTLGSLKSLLTKR